MEIRCLLFSIEECRLYGILAFARPKKSHHASGRSLVAESKGAVLATAAAPIAPKTAPSMTEVTVAPSVAWLSTQREALGDSLTEKGTRQ